MLNNVSAEPGRDRSIESVVMDMSGFIFVDSFLTIFSASMSLPTRIRLFAVSARSMANSLPMPLLAPVTTTVLYLYLVLFVMRLISVYWLLKCRSAITYAFELNRD